MENHRLKSKLTENNKEFLIQTDSDINCSRISSSVFIDGELVEKVEFPHPDEFKTAEVMELLNKKHLEKKKEIENLLLAYSNVIRDGDPEMMCHLATAFYYKSFYREAKELLETVLQLMPENHQAKNLLALTELALGNTDKAYNHAKDAVEQCPGYADYRNNYGYICLVHGSYRAAVEQFEDALKINLYYSDAYYNLGLALIMNALEMKEISLFTGVISKATDCFRKGALINPTYNCAEFEKGIQLLHSSDLKNAYEILKAVQDNLKSKNQKEKATYHLTFVVHPGWISENSLEERIEYLQNQINKNPGYVDIYPELSRCYLEKARVFWEKGVARYKKAVEINPSLFFINECLEYAEKGREVIAEVMENIGRKD